MTQFDWQAREILQFISSSISEGMRTSMIWLNEANETLPTAASRKTSRIWKRHGHELAA
jgi:hypothetical protein